MKKNPTNMKHKSTKRPTKRKERKETKKRTTGKSSNY